MSKKFFRLSKRRKNWQTTGTQADQRMYRFEFPMKSGSLECGIRVGTVPAQDFEERNLYLTFAGYTARCNQAQGFVD